LLNNKLRITGGSLRSRNLNFSSSDFLKPTKSYIRESIFNIIKIKEDMTCLDLYCGSGILSAESISRGLKSAILVDNNSKTCKKINDEFAKLNIKNYNLICDNVLKFIKNYNNKSHDIIFIDPPFASNYLLKTLKLLNENNFFEDNQYIYIEQNKKDNSSELVTLLSKTHNILKDLSMGDVSYTIARKRDK
jgi:16S rRNA (guanine966-N2)-methyltransferase|tara:strand:+ start:216 stop:788 length:573 start_codon:yes stop_codon:yes gene_type:complete